MTDRSLQDRNFGTLKPTRKGEEVQADICPTVSQNGDGADQKTDVDDFYYYPSSLEIPNIDVPESLPDLPGKFQVMVILMIYLNAYNMVKVCIFKLGLMLILLGIADSFDLEDDILTPLFPTKPLSKAPSQTSNSATNHPPASSNFQPETSNSIVSSVTSTLEEPSSFQSRPSPNIDPGKANHVPVSTAPMPPPPPPPPVMMDTPKEAAPTSSSASMGGDLRSSLMAAIREAGGSGNARLKSAKDRKYEAKKKKQDEKEKTIADDLQDGGDLMADLKNTLAMRRRVRTLE